MAETQGATFTTLGRVGDYLFGRNALIGAASFMLLVLSGYATWHGMRDFIVGVSQTPSSPNGGFSISDDILVIAVVAVLTFLMWLALRETFGVQRRLIERLVTFPLYVFLAIWSIGFGYGFWWSLISGDEATRTSLSGLQEDARDASAVISARLDAVSAQLDSVVSWSDGQMAREENSGGSCGTPSGAGRGPLYQARKTVRDSVAGLRDSMTRSWFGPVKTEVELLRRTAADLGGGTVEERQRAFEAKTSEIRGTARAIAARSDALGTSTANEMRALSASLAIAPDKAGFTCYDPTLAQRLQLAADEADKKAQLVLRDAAFSEGPAGVANAVKNLWTNIGAYSSSLVSYVFSGGDVPKDAVADGTPITGRDLIALLATLGIDLGLLALAILNPPAAAPVREDGLASTQAELHLPSPSVIRTLSSAIETAIARAPGADVEWVRRHLIHHDGSSYFVIPNLYSVDQADKNEELRALAVNQLAGVLDDLKLVRALKGAELRRFGREEMRDSYSDLTPFRDERDQRRIPTETAKTWWKGVFDPAPTVGQPGEPRIRNHGLLSKAQRALDIAGWSANAQSDVEIYRLVDTEGLTPLLTLLNEATLAKGLESVEAARKEREPLALQTEEKKALEAEKRLQIEDQRDAET